MTVAPDIERVRRGNVEGRLIHLHLRYDRFGRPAIITITMPREDKLFREQLTRYADGLSEALRAWRPSMPVPQLRRHNAVYGRTLGKGGLVYDECGYPVYKVDRLEDLVFDWLEEVLEGKPRRKRDPKIQLTASL